MVTGELCGACDVGLPMNCRCEPPDPFAGPTQKPQETTRVKPGSNGEWIYKDGRGRYSAPCPITGERRSWQRVTNAVRPLDDGYALAKWGEARAAVGLAQRPALLARVQSLTLEPEHKEELEEVIERAKDHAGASDAADFGTSHHTWTHRFDRGSMSDDELETMPDAVLDDLHAYRDALRLVGLVIMPGYIERTVCLPRWGVMGTFDRLLMRHPSAPPICDVCPSDALHVGDLKTGANELKYGQVKAAQQFALYAAGEWMVNATRDGWEPMPRVCPHVGVMMHLPVGSARCDLYRVDLMQGASLAALSRQVTEARKSKGLVTPWG